MIENGYNVVMNEKTKAEEMKLKSLAKFAKEIMLPICLNSLKHENRKYLGDSKGVIEIMHKFGLSSRYLGLMLDRAEECEMPQI